MSGRELRNISHSVHSRLLNVARETGQSFNDLIMYYAMERFLYRLSQTKWASRFVLKGALMLRAREMALSRPTRDIDLLGMLDNQASMITAAVRTICTHEIEKPDGLLFDPETVEVTDIAGAAEYQGMRATFRGTLGNVRLSMQVDIGFGDSAYPRPQNLALPALLDFPPACVKAYTMESTIAEKFHAMVERGTLNSRMKDFYDIAFLAGTCGFEGAVLAEAVARTFRRRETEIPAGPVAFTPEFAASSEKAVQWRAFVRKSRMRDAPSGFNEVVTAAARLLEPVAQTLAAGEPFAGCWSPGGPWSERK